MVRPATSFSLRGLCVACALVVSPAAAAAQPDAVAPADKAQAAGRMKELRAKLAKPVILENAIGKTPLREALEFLSDRYDVTILVNMEAFKSVGIEAVEDSPVNLPKMVGGSLGTVLRLILTQVHGTYLLRPYFIEVAPIERARPEFWKEKRNLAPTVNAEFTGHPLDSALRELSEASGISVVLDGRVGDKARTSVTASLNNVPIDTAVLILADMADLRPVTLDNLLYVTTKKNAEDLTAWHDRQRKKPTELKKSSSPTEPKADSAGKPK